VDDGAHDLEMALRMLYVAADQGITHVACTSHGNDRAGERTDELLHSVFAELREAVQKLALPVELCLGSELMLGADILRVLALPFATYRGMKKYCLLEFPIETPFEIVLNAVRTIRKHGLHTLLAHFERFSRAHRTVEQVKSLRQAGAIITLDAGTLEGQFGVVLEKKAKQLLEWNVVDVLASDAHDDGEHGFRLKAGREEAREIVGPAAASRLVLDHPRLVWEGLPWPEPECAGVVK
jgi:protein-tyrosine phosphatase